MISGIVGFLILAAWVSFSMRVRLKAAVNQSNDVDRSDVPMIPALMGRMTVPLFRRGAAAIGKQSARNYGSGPLPLGYWRPRGPSYRPRRTNVYHTEVVKIPEPVKGLVPVKRNSRALVAFSRPIVAPRFLLGKPVVPPAIRFSHLRVLGAAGVPTVGPAAWAHGFWRRDYSLLPVKVDDSERPEWLACTVDPETEEPTSRYLTPSEIDALGFGEDSSGGKDKGTGGKMQSVATLEPCNILSWSTWLNCLLTTPEEDVIAEEEVVITKELEICRDAIATCDESSCDNGQRPFCAKTCGIYPCPPVEMKESADDQTIADEEMSTVSDLGTGCTVLSCMSFVGRMLCMRTCGAILSNPAQNPYETAADLDTVDDSYPGCTVLDCMTLVGRLLCQKTCHFHPSQAVLEKPAPKVQEIPITDIEDLVLDVKSQPSSFDAPKRNAIKNEYEDDNGVEDDVRIKDVMDQVIEDELQAQDQQMATLPDVVLADDSSGEEVQEILDRVASDPDVLLKGAELQDSLCALLTVGAFDCIAVDDKCRCFYILLPGTQDSTDCSHMYPSRKTALAVVKNARLALFRFDQCSCDKSSKMLHRNNSFYACDLVPFSNHA